MALLSVLLALFLLVAGFVWFRPAMKTWLLVAVAVFTFGLFSGDGGTVLSLILLIGLAPTLILLFYAPELRKKYLSAPLLMRVQKTMPTVSQTEREAIDAGTVWWDGELFGGAPDWNKLLAVKKPALSAREQKFLDDKVESLCAMLDDWDITNSRNDLPPAVWSFHQARKIFRLKRGDRIRRTRIFGIRAIAHHRQTGDAKHDRGGNRDGSQLARTGGINLSLRQRRAKKILFTASRRRN